MSGHNKWSKVKRQKGVSDAKKAKVFAKLAREIGIAVRAGGPEADLNPRLRMILLKCRSANMPADNIDRAIKLCEARDFPVLELVKSGLTNSNKGPDDIDAMDPKWLAYLYGRALDEVYQQRVLLAWAAGAIEASMELGRASSAIQAAFNIRSRAASSSASMRTSSASSAEPASG